MFTLENQSYKKLIVNILKLLVSAVAIYFVFVKIDAQEVWILVKKSNILLLMLALLFFNFSKILSALRLNLYFRSIQIDLSNLQNLNLYYVGMFYNLFLPGGIGGDAYKVYLLNKKFKTPLKKISAAVLLDRLSGLFALAVLSLLLSFIVFDSSLYFLSLLGIAIAFAFFKLMSSKVFPSFDSVFFPTLVQAFGVQLLQLIQILFTLWALGEYQNNSSYLLVFLASSVVAVFPVSIGGVGLRELTFLYFGNLLFLNQEIAIAVSVLFFVSTAISSLLGAFIQTKEI